MKSDRTTQALTGTGSIDWKLQDQKLRDRELQDRERQDRELQRRSSAVHDTAVHDTAVHDTAIREIPTQGASAHHTSAHDTAVHDTAVRKVPAQGASAHDTSTQGASAHDTSTQGASVDDTSTHGASAHSNSAHGNSAHSASVRESRSPERTVEPGSSVESDKGGKRASPQGLNDRELFDCVVDFEGTIQRLHAQSMIPRAAAVRRKAHMSRRYRSNATGIAAETRQSRATCARNSNQAVTLVDRLPQIYNRYADLTMNRSQIDLLCRLYDNRILRSFVERDQTFFISRASEPWPIFRTLVGAWERATLDREDPDEPAGKAFKNRKLVWGHGLDKEVLGEFHMPNELFEQFKEIVTPFYDALLREEVRDARLAAGQDPEIKPDENEFFDLARSNSQRWLDAMLAALRVRGRLLRNLKQQSIQDGDPEDELQINLDDADAGVAAEVIIIADQETLEREQARQAGHELPPRSADSAANSRCETLSGLPVSPATALLYAQLGSFRRMVLGPDNLDFSMSRKARFFTGAKRKGLIVRDRHCQGPGCDTAGKFCQGDHIKEFSKGGPTIPTNAELLCGPCNRHKEWLRTHAIRK